MCRNNIQLQIQARMSIALLAIALLLSVVNGAEAGSGFRILYHFCNAKNCKHGAYPTSGLIIDVQGNLFGTTFQGGPLKGDQGCPQQFGSLGCGVAYELSTGGTYSILHSFRGRDNGSGGTNPAAPLASDDLGNFYGTTQMGGIQACVAVYGSIGCGTVFKLAADGKHKLLYSFAGGQDGGVPAGGLLVDSAGNLYGMTTHGGLTNQSCLGADQTPGCGVIYKIAQDGTESALHAFGYTDGAFPIGSLITDEQNNLFGTAAYGGSDGCGVIFKLASDGTYSVLYNFTGKNGDGCGPNDLGADDMGNFYGTTSGGGKAGCGGLGCGTVFAFSAGAETVTYQFTGGSDGGLPNGVISDQNGQLFGTTTAGGLSCSFNSLGCGVIYKLSSTGTETVLHSFTGDDGAIPNCCLTADANGILYGTTGAGGAQNNGVVFCQKK